MQNSYSWLLLINLELLASISCSFIPLTHSARSSAESEWLFARSTLKCFWAGTSATGCNPPRNRSCQEILHCYQSATSGYYQIQASNGSLVKVYCDMEGTHCMNITGWTRVAYINMTQPNASCPHCLTLQTFPSAGLISLCGKESSGCQSALFPTIGLTLKCAGSW